MAGVALIRNCVVNSKQNCAIMTLSDYVILPFRHNFMYDLAFVSAACLAIDIFSYIYILWLVQMCFEAK